jgi:hypothetical protein
MTSAASVRYTEAVTRSSLSFALALAVSIPPGCKKEEAPAAASVDPAKPMPTTPADPTKPAPATPTSPASPTVPPLTPTVAATPAAALDPLLDLVGKDAKTWFVIRAPQDFVTGHASVVTGSKSQFERLLDAMKDESKGPDADAGMRKLFVEFDVVQTALASSGLHLDKGIAVTTVSPGNSVTVIAADDVDAWPKIERALNAKPDEVKTKCKPLTEAPGFFACADDEAVLAAFVPARSAATLRTTMTNQLGAETLDASNVLVHANGDDGLTTAAVRTSGGTLQVDIRAPGVEPYLEVDAPGPASALAVVKPGGSFAWMRLDVAAIAKKSAGAPAMATNMITALSGEILLAGIGASPGAVMLIGLSDPTPIQGLIPMASLMKDKVPKSLPDGSKLEMIVESTDDGAGGTLQVLRLKVEPSAELAKIRDQLGLASELTAFVTSKWAAIGLGTGTAAIPEVARATAGEPSAELLAALPAGFATDLKGGRTSMAWHLELDGLQAPGVREQLATALASAVPADSKLSATDVADVVFAMLSPMSSWSFWTSSATDGGVVFHFAVRAFGDEESDEGRAAKQARLDVTAKSKDAAAAYGALVATYPTSARLAAYHARAGTGSAGAATGVAAMAGVMAALAVPAFKKYIERSKSEASAPAVPPAK